MEENVTLTGLKPKLDPTITFGHMIQITLLAISVIGGFFYVKAELDSSKTAREKYIPIVESLVKSDIVQDQRMNNLAEAVIDIRKSQTIIADKLSDIAKTVAVIEERTKQKAN